MKLSAAQQRLLVELATHEAACKGGVEVHANERRTAYALAEKQMLTLVPTLFNGPEAELTAEGWRQAYILLNARHAALLVVMREVADANEYCTGSISQEALCNDERAAKCEVVDLAKEVAP